MATNNAAQSGSVYSGSLLENLGLYVLGTLITVCTLGIGFPIAANLFLQKRNDKVSVTGSKLIYNGNSSGLFKVYIFSYATVIAALVVSAAIYMVAGSIGLYCMLFVVFMFVLYGIVCFLNYVKEKSSFEKSEGGSYFDGTTFQLFLVCLPSAVLPFVVAIVTHFVKMPCILSLVLRFISILVCVIIFVNSFVPWVIEHSMTSGKCYTFKGTVKGSFVPVLALSIIAFVATLVPSFVVKYFDYLSSQILMMILLFFVLLIVSFVFVYLLDVWASSNRDTVPENAREVNNQYTKFSIEMSEKSKAAKTAISNFDEKLRDGFSSFPTVVKILFTFAFAVVVAILFYLIFN